MLPPKEATSNHSIWTKYLSQEIRRAITTNFDKKNCRSHHQGIEEAKSSPDPRFYCQEGKYATMVELMNHAGLLKGRLGDVWEKRLSNYTKNLQITSFAINKSVHKERLISWTRIADLFSAPPSSPDLPYPSLFEFIGNITGNQADIYLYI